MLCTKNVVMLLVYICIPTLFVINTTISCYRQLSINKLKKFQILLLLTKRMVIVLIKYITLFTYLYSARPLDSYWKKINLLPENIVIYEYNYMYFCCFSFVAEFYT